MSGIVFDTAVPTIRFAVLVEALAEEHTTTVAEMTTPVADVTIAPQLTASGELEDSATLPDPLQFVETMLRVYHLYQHREDAIQCAERYQQQLNRRAVVATFTTPIETTRDSDTWVLFAPDTRKLMVFSSQEEADDALILRLPQTLQAITTPIRKAMPVQQGIPQFRVCGKRALD